MKMIKYDLKGVNNQYNIEGGRRACIPICILTLFHLYKRIKSISSDDDNLQLLLNQEEWNILLERGVSLYGIWEKRRYKIIFPTINDILSLDECKSFHNLFYESIEVTGLVKDNDEDNNTNNIEGNLLSLFNRIRQETIERKSPVCALVVIPINICISVICKSHYNIHLFMTEYSFIMFDSHGGKLEDGKYCELIQFFTPYDIYSYIIKKYKIESLSDIDPEFRDLYTEEEIVSYFAYYTKIFK
jgi:hypothetical protein